MEIKGIAENCFKCKYHCVENIDNSTKRTESEGKYGETIYEEVKTKRKSVFIGDLQETFDYLVNSSNEYDGIDNMQFKIINREKNRYGKFELTYWVYFKDGWNAIRAVQVISSDSAYKILARAFRETFKDDELTVWQDKVE